MRHNPFILSGYRFGYTAKMCLRSVFMVHNETGNVWTHLLGFLFFIWLGCFSFLNIVEEDWSHRLIFLVYIIGNLTCMGSSTVYHLMGCHSEHVMHSTVNVDYFGISAIMTASFLPPLYFVFTCWPTLQLLYMSQVLILGGATLVAPFIERFKTNEWYMLRMGLYIVTAISGFVPTIHSIFLFPPSNHITRAVHLGIFLMFLFYGVGTVIYVTKIPERFYPGRFDIWFNSHQVWHILVFLAAAVHFFTCIGIYQRFGSADQC